MANLGDVLTIVAYSGVILTAFTYLTVDLYPQVKSFRVIFRTGSFWLLVIVFSALNVLAFGAMSYSLKDTIQSKVGPSVTLLALIILSTLGTMSFLQSLVLKIGDKKFVDVGGSIDKFRSTVLENCGKNDADFKRKRVFRTTVKLQAAYQGNPQNLRQLYVQVFPNRDVAQLAAELNELQQQANTASVSFEGLLANRIAAADIELAEEACQRN